MYRALDRSDTRTARAAPASRRAAPWPLVLLVVVALTGLIATACGDDSDQGAQPRENEPLFGEGEFDDIPLVPGSRELGPAAAKDGVVAQSFFTQSRTPEQVLDFYRDTLDGEWQLTDPPRQLGADQTWRGRWTRGDESLVVSATDDDTVEPEDDADVGTQYSLSLGPDQFNP